MAPKKSLLISAATTLLAIGMALMFLPDFFYLFTQSYETMAIVLGVIIATLTIIIGAHYYVKKNENRLSSKKKMVINYVIVVIVITAFVVMKRSVPQEVRQEYQCFIHIGMLCASAGVLFFYLIRRKTKSN